jgi:hypothetical protein
MKHSYHLIFHTDHYLKGIDNVKTFKMLLENELYKSTEDYLQSGVDGGFSVDTAVYGKNNQFKLPYQSKYGSTRTHIPSENRPLDDFLVSPSFITSLEPVNLPTTVENVEESVTGKLKNLRRKGVSVGNKDKRLLYLLGRAYDDTPKVTDWNGSYAVYDIVNVIPNNENVSYQLYLAVMCSIKRAVKDHSDNDGYKLFLEWAKKSSKYSKNGCSNAKDRYDAVSEEKGYGFLTLLLIAQYVCPALQNSNYYLQRLKIQRTPDITINTNRFNFNDYDSPTIYAKSGMSTGKSYSIHNIPSGASCVFLSSRQAFANSQSFDFKDDGFVNYLDEATTFIEDRIIISLESINRLRKNKYDYVIIDESESIFNIISSPTLIKRNFLECVRKFENLIAECNKLVVLDAFLTERSINAVEKMRKAKSLYIHNQYPAPKRSAEIVGKDVLAGQIVNMLNENKRCVFVCGSKSFGEFVVSHIQKDTKNKTILFYNSANKLGLDTDVNKEWEKADCLIYTPSITCGISYTGKPFDNLFIYAVNINSAHFRDMIQASRRCRHIQNPHISICINDKFTVTDEVYPTYPDTINYKKNRYTETIIASNEVLSLNTLQKVNAWVNDVDTFNIMERNIHSVYLREVVKYYFEEENIELKKLDEDVDYTLDDGLKEDSFIKGENIRLIDGVTFAKHSYTLTKQTLSSEEMAEFYYYVFYYWLKRDENTTKQAVDKIYDDWGEDRAVLKNLKKFKKLFQDNFYIEKNGIAEHVSKTYLPLTTLYKNLTALEVLKDDCIDTTKEFTRDDLMKLEYKGLKVFEINQLCQKRVFQKKDVGSDGLLSKYSDKRVVTILNALLERIGYRVDIDVTRVSVGKKQVRQYTYKIQTKYKPPKIDANGDVELPDGNVELTPKDDLLRKMNSYFDDSRKQISYEMKQEILWEHKLRKQNIE